MTPLSLRCCLRAPAAARVSVAAVLLAAAAAVAAAGPARLVSVAPGGGPALTPAAAGSPLLSADGRYLVFLSNALDLAPGGNGRVQLYLRDRATGTVELVSRGVDGSPADRDVRCADISADGRFVAFSTAAALLPGDTNRFTDVFIRDRETGTLRRASVTSSGVLGDQGGGSYGVALSADGSRVAFDSHSALVPADTNDRLDVYVRDEKAGSTMLASVGPGGTQGNDDSGMYGLDLSARGDTVAFNSLATNLVAGDSNGTMDLFVRDLPDGATTRVSVATGGAQADDESREPSVSADGRWVAFYSSAENLVPDVSSGYRIFVRDRLEGTTTRANEAGSWAVTPRISPDGRWVAYVADDRELPDDRNDLPDVYLRDRLTGALERVSAASGGEPDGSVSRYIPPALSADGRWVAFASDAANLAAGDTNFRTDVFVRDRSTRQTTRESLTGDGRQAVAGATSAGPALTPDGRRLAFLSDADNLVPDDRNGAPDVFLADLETGRIELVSIGIGGAPSVPGPSHEPYLELLAPALSADARCVAFVSEAANLVPGDTNGWVDVFVRDREQGTTERVSVASDGAQARFAFVGDGLPAISADSSVVAFHSSAPNLVPGDTNNTTDLFVRDRVRGVTERVSVASDGSQADARPRIVMPRPAMDAAGRLLGFCSASSRLVSGDGNGWEDIFVRDRQAGTTERVSVALSGGDPNGQSWDPCMSADGRFVAFTSWASNLVESDTNRWADVFVYDRLERRMERVSLGRAGEQSPYGARSPALSPDGRCVAFLSYSDNLVAGDTNGTVDVFVRDRVSGTTERVNSAFTGGESAALQFGAHLAVAARGAAVVFAADTGDLAPGDTNGTMDLFLVGRAVPPNAPEGLRAEEVTDTTVRLAWVDRSEDEVAFDVERSADGGATWNPAGGAPPVPGTGSTVASFDSGLAPATRYGYRVCARGVDLPSDPSPPLFVTTLPAPRGSLSVAAKVEFGRGRLGRSVTRTLVVRNRSEEQSLRVAVAAPAPPFRLDGGARSVDVPPGGSASFTLGFSPTAPRPAQGVLVLTSSDPARTRVEVRLRGAGRR